MTYSNLSPNEITAPRPTRTPDQLRQEIKILQSIVDLAECPGWEHLIAFVNKREVPRYRQIKDANHAIQIASEVAYVTGMTDILDFPKINNEKLMKLKQELDQCLTETK